MGANVVLPAEGEVAAISVYPLAVFEGPLLGGGKRTEQERKERDGKDVREDPEINFMVTALHGGALA